MWLELWAKLNVIAAFVVLGIVLAVLLYFGLAYLYFSILIPFITIGFQIVYILAKKTFGIVRSTIDTAFGVAGFCRDVIVLLIFFSLERKR